MIEMKAVMDEFMKDPENAELEAKFTKILENADLQAMEEFTDIAEATENGKIVAEDTEFEKALQEELGLPDLD
jgi:hypothetical protein